jgi:hypothetical protein
MMFYVLRELAWKLFQIDFMLDWGGSDRAIAFINANISFWNNPTFCDPAYRVVKATNESNTSNTHLVDLTNAEALLFTEDALLSKNPTTFIVSKVTDRTCLSSGQQWRIGFNLDQTSKEKSNITNKTVSAEDVLSAPPLVSQVQPIRCGLICQQATKKEGTCTCQLDETCLQCT